MPSVSRRFANAVPLLALLLAPALAHAQPLAARQSLPLDGSSFFPSGLAAADFDGDGRADLAASSTSGHLSVLRNAGGFVPTSIYRRPDEATTDGRPTALEDVVAADLNGDGRADLVAPSANTNQLVVSLNAAATSGLAFQAPVTYTAGSERLFAGLGGVAVADFDGDGRVDLAASRNAGPGVSGGFLVLPGRSDGTFGAAIEVAVGGVFASYEYVNGVTAADFNGDGRADLAVTGSAGTFTSNEDRGRVVVLLNRGGAFGFSATEVPVEFRARRVTAGDVNGDGRLDLTAVTRTGVAVLLGTGTGRFAAPIRTAVSTTGNGYLFDAKLGDLDLDGRLDLVVTHGTYQAEAAVVSFHKGDGAGRFTFLRQENGIPFGAASFYYAFGLVVTDLGTDGRPDVAFVTMGGHMVNLYANVSTAPPPAAVLAQGQWSDAFGSAFNGEIHDVLAVGDEVYVAGEFTQAGGVKARGVAVYNRSTAAWSALGDGLGGGIRVGSGPERKLFAFALVLHGDDVVVGGRFDSAGARPAGNVAAWSVRERRWRAPAVGVKPIIDGVRALAVRGPYVFVGGDFVEAGGQTVQGFARWDRSADTWASMGSAVFSRGLGEGRANVTAIALIGSDVYVGGSFEAVGSSEITGIAGPDAVTARSVARYNLVSGKWVALGTSVSYPTNDVCKQGGELPDGGCTSVNAFVVQGGRLAVGGIFSHAGGERADGVAYYDPATGAWTGLVGLRYKNEIVGQDFPATVYGLGADPSGGLFVGGGITEAGGEKARWLARWDGARFVPFAGGVYYDAGFIYTTINAFAVVGGDLFVGGLFNSAGPTPSLAFGRYRLPGLDVSRAEAAGIAAGQPVRFRAVGTETAVTVTFTAPNGQGAVSVARIEAPAANVSFEGAAPLNVSAYRFVIEAEGGFAFTGAEVRFRLADLFGGGITDPSTVTVFRRPVPGQGTFVPLPTRYDAATGELVATTAAFSEFVFGSSAAGNPLPTEESARPGALALSLAGANPFRSATALRYTLPAPGRVRLTVFDALGRRVAVLADGEHVAGTYRVDLVGEALPAGVYFARLETGAGVRTVQVLRVR